MTAKPASASPTDPGAGAGEPPPGRHARLTSLDQFRGYTVAGMFFVNFAGAYAVLPAVFKHHHTYCSYADVIMPQFLFAVGFALRLVLLRNVAALGAAAAYARTVRRVVSLFLIALVFYHLDFGGPRDGSRLVWFWKPVTTATLWRETFQTLAHIAVTSFWVLPVIAGSAKKRLVFGALSVAAHLGLSAAFWYDLLHVKRVIDGGPLAFLTWTVCALAGSFAYDFRQSRGARASLRPLVGWGSGLMGLGYAISCLGVGGPLAAPPFVPPDSGIDMWTMSQRAGSASYLVFAAGFAMVLYAGFVWVCDVKGRSLAFFGILGSNALAGYLLHELVGVAFLPLKDREAPWWEAMAVTALFIAVVTGLVWLLNRRGWYLRL